MSSSRKNKVKVDDDDDNKTTASASGVHIDLGGMIFILILLYILLFLYGSSIRGVTKMVERDAVKLGHAPSSITYALWFILNSFLLGIPGFVMNLTVPDVFEDIPVVRSMQAMGIAHGVEKGHFAQPVGQTVAQPVVQTIAQKKTTR